LPLDPSFAGSNPAQNDGFLRETEVLSTISFREEEKPLAPVVRFYSMLKIPAEYDKDTSPAKLKEHFLPSFPHFATNNKCLC
jgi:hypothetical protein